MTRINSVIPVRNLTDEHLLAEHREIKRLPYCLHKSVSCGSIRNIPKETRERFKSMRYELEELVNRENEKQRNAGA